MTRSDRGQLVLLAAAVVAVALTPVVLAVLQFGYHPDVRASRGYAADGPDAERVLTGALHRAAAGVPADFPWSERDRAVVAVRDRLRPRLAAFESARVESGTGVRVDYNASAAAGWARERCPRGPDRQFGPCEVVDGLVVQERVGETHVLAASFDVLVTTRRGRSRFTVTVRPVGD